METRRGISACQLIQVPTAEREVFTTGNLPGGAKQQNMQMDQMHQAWRIGTTEKGKGTLVQLYTQSSESVDICEIRHNTYEEAKRRQPKRWSRYMKNWQQPEIVKINHPSPIKSIEG